MIYFAHCMKDYHTKHAKKYMDKLKESTHTPIFDPAWSSQEGWAKEGMEYWHTLHERHNFTALVALPVRLKDGSYAFGSGVWWEMQAALQCGLDVHVIGPPTKKIRVLTRYETRMVIRGDL